MDFFRKLFRSDQKPQSPPTTKEKSSSSMLTWICAGKSDSKAEKSVKLSKIDRKLTSTIINSSVSNKETNKSKGSQRASFPADSELSEEEFVLSFVTLIETFYYKTEDLIQGEKMYGVICPGSQNPFLSHPNYEDCLWLKIGRNEELNSLSHLRPYSVDEVFMLGDGELGFEYSVEELVRCSQEVNIRMNRTREVQAFVSCYERELVRLYGFRLIGDCLNRLHISIMHAGKRDLWLKINAKAEPDTILNEILEKIGFGFEHPEAEYLKYDIAKGLNLEEYIEIIKHKQKLGLQYEEQSVEEFIKNKLLEKLGSARQKSTKPFKKMSEDLGESEYQEYFLSINSRQNPIGGPEDAMPRIREESNPVSNTLSRDSYEDLEDVQHEEEIFNFKVYTDEREQQAKRLAIVKDRKQRSRSADIPISQLERMQQGSDYLQEIE